MMRRTGEGKRQVVTVAVQPVAQLSPIDAPATAMSMADLVSLGHVIAPRRRSAYVGPEPVLLRTGARIDQALREVRT